MKIAVELSASEWDEIVHLAQEKDNEFITEEEYADKLFVVIGNKLRTKPIDGDELVLSLRKPIFVMGNPDIN